MLNFILTELNEVLVDIQKDTSSETGRVNENVVKAFLARIYLHEKNYDKVLEYTKAIIDSGNYGLYRAFDGNADKNSYEELFRPQADGNNNEIIFEKQYSAPLKVHALNRNLSPASSVYLGWTGLRPLQSLVDEYECLGGHATSECERLNCKYVQMREEVSAMVDMENMNIGIPV